MSPIHATTQSPKFHSISKISFFMILKSLTSHETTQIPKIHISSQIRFLWFWNPYLVMQPHKSQNSIP